MTVIGEELYGRLGRLEGTQDLILVTVKELRGDLNVRLADIDRRIDVLENFKVRIGVFFGVATAALSGVSLFASDIIHYFVGKH